MNDDGRPRSGGEGRCPAATLGPSPPAPHVHWESSARVWMDGTRSRLPNAALPTKLLQLACARPTHCASSARAPASPGEPLPKATPGPPSRTLGLLPAGARVCESFRERSTPSPSESLQQQPAQGCLTGCLWASAAELCPGGVAPYTPRVHQTSSQREARGGMRHTSLSCPLVPSPSATPVSAQCCCYCTLSCSVRDCEERACDKGTRWH